MLLLNLPFLLVGYLVKFGMFIVRGYGRAYWQGTREAFADLPHCSKSPASGSKTCPTMC